MRALVTAFLLLILSLQSLCAQQLWRVCCAGGPNVNFTDLQQAISAASPGDEIWVYYDIQGCPGGTFYNAPIIDKPLRIAGFFAGPGGFSGPSQVNLHGAIVILNIPAGQRVELSGFVTVGVVGNPYSGVVALDCQGDVLLDNITIVSSGGPEAYARFERCSNVVLRNCEFQLGGSPLRIIDSNVLLTTALLYHASPSSWGPYATNAEGIRVVNSTVTAIGSVIRGADRALLAGFYLYVEQPGVIVQSGVFCVGPATILEGGLGSSPQFPAYGFTVLNPSIGSVEQDPRGVVVRPPPAPAAVPINLHATFHNWLVANESFGVTVTGPPGGFAVLAIGDWLPHQSTPFGTLAIDPATAVPLDLVALPVTTGTFSNGSFQWTMQCPATAPINHAFAFQAMTLAPNGTLGLSVPSPLLVGWPHGAIP